MASATPRLGAPNASSPLPATTPQSPIPLQKLKGAGLGSIPTTLRSAQPTPVEKGWVHTFMLWLKDSILSLLARIFPSLKKKTTSSSAEKGWVETSVLWLKDSILSLLARIFPSLKKKPTPVLNPSPASSPRAQPPVQPPVPAALNPASQQAVARRDALRAANLTSKQIMEMFHERFPQNCLKNAIYYEIGKTDWSFKFWEDYITRGQKKAQEDPRRFLFPFLLAKAEADLAPK